MTSIPTSLVPSTQTHAEILGRAFAQAAIDAPDFATNLIDTWCRILALVPGFEFPAPLQRAALPPTDEEFAVGLFYLPDPLFAQLAFLLELMLARNRITGAALHAKLIQQGCRPYAPFELVARPAAAPLAATENEGCENLRAAEAIARTFLQAPQEAELLEEAPALPTAEAASEPAPKPAQSQPVFTESQGVALKEICDLGELFFNPEPTPVMIAPRLDPLIAGPTGAGKSRIVREAAKRLGAEYFPMTFGDWIPQGANRKSTLFVLMEKLLVHDRVICHVDELDKWRAGFDQTWATSISNDLWNALDRRFPVAEFFVARKAEAEKAPDLGPDPWPEQVPDEEMLAEKVRTKLFFVGSGTWQTLFDKARTPVGFGAPSREPEAVSGERIRQDKAIPIELTARFYSKLVILRYPNPKEAADFLEHSQLQALARSLDRPIDPASLDFSVGGMRLFESLHVELLREQRRRHAAAPTPTASHQPPCAAPAAAQQPDRAALPAQPAAPRPALPGASVAERLRVVGDPQSSPVTLDALAHDPVGLVRRLIALHQATSPAALQTLARDPDLLVRRAVAAHPACPPESLEALAREGDPDIRLAVARHPSATALALAALAGQWPDDFDTCLALATDPQTAEPVLRLLAQDRREGVRRAVLRNPAYTPLYGQGGAPQPEPSLRVDGAYLPEEHLHRFLRWALAAPKPVALQKIRIWMMLHRQAGFDHRNWYTPPELCAILRHPNLAPETVRALATHRDRCIREQVASAALPPAIAAEVFGQLAADPAPSVRRAVAGNPAAPAALRAKLQREEARDGERQGG